MHTHFARTQASAATKAYTSFHIFYFTKNIKPVLPSYQITTTANEFFPFDH